MLFLYFLNISGLKIPVGTFVVLLAELGWSEELPGLWEGWSPCAGMSPGDIGEKKGLKRGEEGQSKAASSPSFPKAGT